MTKRTILEEIRNVRHAISEEIGHDPRRITDYYARIQADLKNRIINRSGESKFDQTVRCAVEAKSGDSVVENLSSLPGD